MRSTLTGIVLAALLFCAAASVADEGRPPILRDVGFDQRIGEQVPLDLVFHDEQGEAVALGDYFGRRPVVLVPAYYRCPMLCTVVLNGVTSALRALAFDVGREFDVVTFSFDPTETSALAAAKKEQYLGQYRRPGAASGWHFLVGDEAAIHRLTEAIGFRFAYDEAQRQYAHASGIVVLTPEGRVSRYFFGVEYAPKDLRLALVEASEHRIGSFVDQLLLFCFHYDPATGRYSRVALDVLRAGGAATLLALVAGVALMLRRERSPVG
jgi:protein SCO1/2